MDGEHVVDDSLMQRHVPWFIYSSEDVAMMQAGMPTLRELLTGAVENHIELVREVLRDAGYHVS
jgi:hypothetical protein